MVQPAAGGALFLALLAALAPCQLSGSAGGGAAGAPVVLAPTKLARVGPGEHRIVLDASRIAALRSAREHNSPEWRVVRDRCDAVLAETIPSGYQGFDWTDAVAELSLCWLATDRPAYAAGAIRYVDALLDDRYRVGDGQGGESVVVHDDGYGIRTFAVYTALAYDWLREAPGMDASLRARIAQRLQQWLDWYAKHGYLRDRPFANYYWGYLTALSFAGLALGGESAAGDRFLATARDELANRVLPAFRDRLSDGGWPEGWQYGEYSTLEIVLVVRSLKMAAGLDIARQLPWLGNVVEHHVHALLPDQQTVYDGGAWSEHPATPSALALTSLPLALDGVDDVHAAQARWLVHHALRPLTREQAWVRLLVTNPGAPERDPRAGAATSLLLPQQGLSFMRSDWSRAAVWLSFQAGPFLTDDHQNKDQGHFELWRGRDALLVDGGDYEGSATINHNTVLVDDGGAHMNYTPNQGVWGTHVATRRFGDDDEVVVAVGDLADAYAPACVQEGCTARSVERFVRTLVYVRPAMIVIDDRLRLEKASYGTTWAAHVTVAPQIDDDHASAIIGASRVDVRLLEPAGVRVSVVREPSGSGEGPHRLDKPWGPMWRLEAASPRGLHDRRFLSFITAVGASAEQPRARRVIGDGLDGLVGDAGARRIAVLFANPARAGRIDLGEPVAEVIVVGLDPGVRFRVDVACETSKVSVVRDSAGVEATTGGFVRARPGCATP